MQHLTQSLYATLANAQSSPRYSEADNARTATRAAGSGTIPANSEADNAKTTGSATSDLIAIRDARKRAKQPEIDAYAHLEGLHGSMRALLLEAEKADETDSTAGLA